MNIKDWAKQINWDQRIKAVCKPCWEIKYCPYGPLVEYMPTESDETDKLCRIFGHICPVFSVAEPFTETKNLRTITRKIPRDVQFRVSRRDNNVCQICCKNVLDKDIHFDHIIPWSKGGSSDENNIRILCPTCNLERSNNLESELLVINFNELSGGLIDISQEMLYDILLSIHVINLLNKDIEFSLDFENIALKLNLNNEQKEIAEIVYKLAFELNDLILNSIENYFKKTECQKIKYRFGYNSKKQVHTISETAKRYGVSANNIKNVEKKILNFIGLNLHYVDSEEEILQYDTSMVEFINDSEI
ncbi:MAG: HNH endonuclease signature motif containing protein [Bacilli bacterium]